jgi:glycosyltransferase involved in cell wall biosynthesis
MNPLLFGHEGIELSYRIEKFYEFKKILYSPEIIIYHDFAYSDFKLDIKEKRHKIMMSYLQFLHPDIEDFITDIDYCNSDIRSNMKTSFSIIMPTYNRKQCIKNAIDSLLTQTYKNFELIIVDDGSTDGTDLYLKEIYKEEINNKKIKYFKLPENKGAAFARNFGIRKAKNKWIGYLDTDNQMHNDFLETFADSIKASAHEIYYAQTKPRKSQIIFGSAFNFDELVQFNLIDLGVFIHSVQIYKELGGFDVSLNRAIDWDLIIKYTEKYPPKFIEKILLDYDDNPESSRISNNESFNEAYKQVILNYYKRIPPEKFIEKYTGRNIQHSQTGNEWLSSQREAWEKAAAEREQSIIALKAYIQDLQTGNAWLSSQREAWEKAAAEREQSIAVLQSQVQDLQTGNAWLSSQREAWEKAAAEREQVIAALQSQGRDLQTGNAWLLSQREAWEKVAAERKFILDKIRNHWGMRFVNFLSKTKLF